MIKIKDKTQLRKALRKNRKEKYLKINSNGNWHFLTVILLKLKTEKVVLKNSVAIPDKHITQLFKKWEAELNKKNRTEIKQDEIKSLKIELCQLKGVLEEKDGQIKLLKEVLEETKREKDEQMKFLETQINFLQKKIKKDDEKDDELKRIIKEHQLKEEYFENIRIENSRCRAFIESYRKVLCDVLSEYPDIKEIGILPF